MIWYVCNMVVGYDENIKELLNHLKGGKYTKVLTFPIWLWYNSQKIKKIFIKKNTKNIYCSFWKFCFYVLKNEFLKEFLKSIIKY